MNRLIAYLRNSRNELAKVVWPSRPQAVRLSINVIVFSVVIALFIGAIDYIFAQVIQKLILKG